MRLPIQDDPFPKGPGYGYEFSVGPKPGYVQNKAESALAEYDEAIRWVLGDFGRYDAADLELISTIVYADRDAQQRCKRIPSQELCQTVKAIKPKFVEEYIKTKIGELEELLTATDLGSPTL